MTLFSLWTEGGRALCAAGVPDAEQDARRLLLEAFGIELSQFLMNWMQPVDETEETQCYVQRYREMIEKRRRRVPLQQILGHQEFMGLDFLVNRHVLIPRQDTETLVELVLQEQKQTDVRVLDLCTGSGCIALSLAVLGRYAQVAAADLSESALEVAKKNGARLAPNVRFLLGDLFDALLPGERFHIITANPPYIPTKVIAELEPEVREHEPMQALDGRGDGLYYYRKLAAQAPSWLEAGGAFYLEIGYDQGEDVAELLRENGFDSIRVVKDLAGKDRVVRGIWPHGRVCVQKKEGETKGCLID